MQQLAKSDDDVDDDDVFVILPITSTNMHRNSINPCTLCTKGITGPFTFLLCSCKIFCSLKQRGVNQLQCNIA